MHIEAVIEVMFACLVGGGVVASVLQGRKVMKLFGARTETQIVLEEGKRDAAKHMVDVARHKQTVELSKLQHAHLLEAAPEKVMPTPNEPSAETEEPEHVEYDPRDVRVPYYASSRNPGKRTSVIDALLLSHRRPRR